MKMKTVLIILGIFITVFALVQVYTLISRSRIESYPFKVIKTFKDIQIRNYEASLFSSVTLPTNEFKKASSQGFSILAGYIFGGNKTNEKIAMTSPVSMSLEDSMTMMFMVPKKFSKENLPKPNQSEIKFHEEPAKTVAAITFGGWANSNKIETYKNKLKASLNTLGISYTNHFYFLGYNPPFDIFNRKNEIIVELDKGFKNQN